MKGGGMMLRKLLSLLMIPAAVLLIPLGAYADPADPEEIAHMKAGHKKVQGVVSEVKSGLYTVKTPTGATYALTESAAVRDGHDVPKVGDEMILWVNEGNMVMNADLKGRLDKAPRFISGTLASIDNGYSQLTLSTSGGEENFKVKPESRMFRDISAGTLVTIEVNESGEVIDIHKNKQ